MGTTSKKIKIITFKKIHFALFYFVLGTVMIFSFDMFAYVCVYGVNMCVHDVRGALNDVSDSIKVICNALQKQNPRKSSDSIVLQK